MNISAIKTANNKIILFGKKKKETNSNKNNNIEEYFTCPNGYYNESLIRNILLKQKKDIKYNEQFCTERNGHILKSSFDIKTRTLDIKSNCLYPANVLSNLYHNPFIFDDIECESIEGFLQSLKYEDKKEQIDVCKLYGGSAKKAGKKKKEWTKDQTLFWQGQPIKRNSKDFKKLIFAVFQACFLQNPQYRMALISTAGMNLSHKSGESDPEKTILTENEFIDTLNEIRKKYI